MICATPWRFPAISEPSAATRIAVAAIGGGLVAGVLLAALTWWWATPYVLAAERLLGEAGAGYLGRGWHTLLTSCAVGIGYGLVLASLAPSIIALDMRRGAVLGLAGFVVFQLAPAIGLPPNPPGVAEAALHARQTWWIGASLSAAAALWLLWRRPGGGLWAALGAAVLIAVPHVIGAPEPTSIDTPVPVALIRGFRAAALGSALLFWLTLGACIGAMLGPSTRHAARYEHHKRLG